MSSDPLNPEQAHERMAAWRDRIDKLAADTAAMSSQWAQVQVSARDPHGLVELTVDSAGSLIGLALSDRCGRVAPAVVADAIMATLRQAKAGLADRSEQIIAGTIGTDSAAGRAIAADVAARLREPQEVQAPAGTAPTAETRRAPSSRHDPDPDDNENRSYLWGR